MHAIGIVGNGVVGNATGKAFAKAGHEVRYWDLNPARTTHTLYQVLDTRWVFVCLPTPAYPTGSCDVTALLTFFEMVRVQWFKLDTTFVLRSTVPVGFTRDLHENHGVRRIYHWPEFMEASTAEADALNPRTVLLGKPGGWVSTLDEEGNVNDPLYQLVKDRFPQCPWPQIFTSDETEAVKVLMNTWFAIKNAAFNEFRTFCQAKKLDWDVVQAGLLADKRIHPVHTQVPGPDGKAGFGGACLPKDLQSYLYQCAMSGVMPFVGHAAAVANEMTRKGGK